MKEKWNCALVVYAIREWPGYNSIHRVVTQIWNVVEPSIYMYDQGYFIVKFQSLEDTQEILIAGPYSINYKPLILKKWTTDFDFSKER